MPPPGRPYAARSEMPAPAPAPWAAAAACGARLRRTPAGADEESEARPATTSSDAGPATIVASHSFVDWSAFCPQNKAPGGPRQQARHDVRWGLAMWLCRRRPKCRRWVAPISPQDRVPQVHPPIRSSADLPTTTGPQPPCPPSPPSHTHAHIHITPTRHIRHHCQPAHKSTRWRAHTHTCAPHPTHRRHLLHGVQALPPRTGVLLQNATHLGHRCAGRVGQGELSACEKGRAAVAASACSCKQRSR
jgi:hypothetical protein